jgi:hypothetical protein
VRLSDEMLSVWLSDTRKVKNMKTKTKNAPVAIVREPVAIDQMFKRNSLGYLESSKAADISLDDAVGYVVTKLDRSEEVV